MTKSMYIEHRELSKAEICQNCKHFYQHYIKIGSVSMPILWGHCDSETSRAKKVYSTCKYFER